MRPQELRSGGRKSLGGVPVLAEVIPSTGIKTKGPPAAAGFKTFSLSVITSVRNTHF